MPPPHAPIHRLRRLLCAALLFAVACSQPSEPLPVLGVLPNFSLTASDEHVVSAADLKGKIWVADFVFTNCPGICPALSAQMGKLQSALARAGLNDVQLVSFSVDPARDTPAVLREYAQRYHADPARWRFLTGERDALYTLIGSGFQLAVADRTPAPDGGDAQDLITHSDRFVLVDGNLQVRATYHALDDGVIEQVVADIKRLRE